MGLSFLDHWNSPTLPHLYISSLSIVRVLKSLRENIDTSSATGRAFLSIMGAVSQMELEIKAERAAAKARGKSGGRPKTDPDKLDQARILYQNSDKSAREVCKLFGFSRRTLFTYMKTIQKPLA
ncbi:MAG: DNA recombinase [Alphaproteobacteria bacterium]|nr:DNA recombinase [Alphaproteobacteria bacterium]